MDNPAMDEPVYDPAYTPSQPPQAQNPDPTPAAHGQDDQQADIVYLPVNMRFLKSISCALKIFELLFGLISWSCVACCLEIGANVWVFLVALLIWLYAIANFIVFTFCLERKLTFVHWGWEELIFNSVAAVLILSAAITESVVASDYYYSAFVASCVFLWFNTILYSIGIVFSFRKLKGKWPWEGLGTTSAGAGSSWSTEQQSHPPPTTVEAPPAYPTDDVAKY